MKKICEVESCGRVSVAKGYCKAHYTRLARGDDTLYRRPIRPYSPQSGECKETDCRRSAKTLGWCKKHYMARLYKTLRAST